MPPTASRRRDSARRSLDRRRSGRSRRRHQRRRGRGGPPRPRGRTCRASRTWPTSSGRSRRCGRLRRCRIRPSRRSRYRRRGRAPSGESPSTARRSRHRRCRCRRGSSPSRAGAVSSVDSPASVSQWLSIRLAPSVVRRAPRRRSLILRPPAIGFSTLLQQRFDCLKRASRDRSAWRRVRRLRSGTRPHRACRR